MLVKDHTEALTKLRPMAGASAANVKPNAQHQATHDRLSKLSGAEFDREYINEMVRAHQETVKVLEQLGGSSSGSAAGAKQAPGSNADLAKVAQDLLPTVRRHLQTAQQIQKELPPAGATGGPNRPASPSTPNPTSPNNPAGRDSK